MNGMDRQLRDLLEAAVGEPPHRVSAVAVRRRVVRRRVVEYAAAAVAMAAIAVLIPVGIGALGRGPGPAESRPAPAPRFTSREYGYTEKLPPGWRSGGPARQRWNGKGSPAYLAPTVDLFLGPGGVQAWVYAAPTGESLAAYTDATIRATRAGHPCSAPQLIQNIAIGGAPARLLGMICGPTRGFLVETAVTIRRGIAFVFLSQNPSGNAPADQRPDRAAFRTFLAGVRLQR